MKYLYKFTFTLFLFITFISCESDNVQLNNETSTISTGIINYVRNNKNSKSTSKETHTLEFQMNTNVNIPKFENKEEFEEYLKVNKNSINGSFVLLMDGIKIYESIIENGVEITENKNKWKSQAFNKANYPCTFDGLSHCTQDSIDSMSFFGKALCIVEGFACVATEFGDCAWQHCGGEEFIQDNTNL